MNEPDEGQPSVVVVLGPRTQTNVVAHTLHVLNHYGIRFKELDWREFADFLAGSPTQLRVVIFETGFAYTDEHLRLLEDVIVPVLRVVTETEPSKQLLTDTALMASMGFGVPGAVNAGLLAARILATSDADLRDLLVTRPYRPS